MSSLTKKIEQAEKAAEKGKKVVGSKVYRSTDQKASTRQKSD